MEAQPAAPSIQIEPMDERSLEAVASVERECFSSPWSLEGLREELLNPLAVFNIAKINGRLAGYAGMHHILDEGYIANIAVSKEFRRMGIAAALLDVFLDYAREHGLVSLTLEVRPSNKAALHLYEKYHFCEEGRRRAYYRNPTEDALLLTLREFKKRE